ncbi:hypothetical protein ACJX0J_009375, partial [Zea mays]
MDTTNGSSMLYSLSLLINHKMAVFFVVSIPYVVCVIPTFLQTVTKPFILYNYHIDEFKKLHRNLQSHVGWIPHNWPNFHLYMTNTHKSQVKLELTHTSRVAKYVVLVIFFGLGYKLWSNRTLLQELSHLGALKCVVGIGGNTSFWKQAYTTKEVPYEHTFVELGNHEWSCPLMVDRNKTLEEKSILNIGEKKSIVWAHIKNTIT